MPFSAQCSDLSIKMHTSTKLYNMARGGTERFSGTRNDHARPVRRGCCFSADVEAFAWMRYHVAAHLEHDVLRERGGCEALLLVGCFQAPYR